MPKKPSRLFGRDYIADRRDSKYRLPRLASERFARYWNAKWWSGDQGYTPHCVGYAVAHFLSANPIRQLLNPDGIYEYAQFIDEWEGTDYDGTSVRAGVKAARNLGFIESFWWAKNVDELAIAILEVGPVVLGTEWLEGMEEPDDKFMIHATGQSLGGHAYLCTGVNVHKGNFQIKNSWGHEWGNGGFATISFEDMAKLIKMDGECCIPVEKRPWE